MKIKRVTVDVDEDTHHALKVKATQQGKTVSEVVRDLLAGFIGKQDTPKAKKGRTV